MWIDDENTKLLFKLQQSNDASLNTLSWVKDSIWNIIDPNYFNSTNFIIGKKILKEKLQYWNTSWIASILMEILTTRPEFLVEKYKTDNSNFLLDLQQKVKPQSDYYKNVISETEKQTKNAWVLEVADNPAWFSLKTKSHSNNLNWLNYKLYLTIPIEWYEYVSKVYQLAKKINELANETNDKISLKVPNSILWFLSHSDSLVIHFKNKDNKEKIEMILEEWKKSNWIKEENRNLWRTKFAVDSNDSSFSQLVANNIEKWFLEHYWKYDNNVLIELALKYAIEQSQKVPKIV